MSACGGDKTTTKNTGDDSKTDVQTGSDAFDDKMPTIDFEEYEFKVLLEKTYNLEYLANYIQPETLVGEYLNDSAYKRNLELEERFNIKITAVDNLSNVEQIITNEVAAGDTTYDLIIPHGDKYTESMAQKNILYDWNDLPYINFDQPWWNKNEIDTLTIADKLFYMKSDITVTNQNIGFIAFNKKMISDLNLDVPYKYVDDGTWTIDKMEQYIKAATLDTDNNGVMNEKDRYGLGASDGHVEAFTVGVGIKQIVKNEEGIPVFAFSNNTGLYEKMASLVDKMHGILNSKDTYIHKYDKEYAAFKAGSTLLETIWGFHYQSLRNIEDFDFGILPYPKYDESQDKYITLAITGIMALPACLDNPERTGIIIEAMSAASAKYVKPMYFETMIETKVLRDEDSVRIYRMIFNNRTSVCETCYAPDNVQLLKTLVVTNKSNEIASYIAKFGPRINNAYKTMYDKILNNG